MENLNFATRWNIDEVDANYIKWLKEPSSLDSSWRIFFEGFHLGSDRESGPNGAEVPVEETLKSTTSATRMPAKSMLAYMEQYIRLGISVILRALSIRSRKRSKKTLD
jgi:2-oxoglutarate dehydrogenase complex dehydrogenase (E1) component-like enzyme